jgi:hypothetical protein
MNIKKAWLWLGILTAVAATITGVASLEGSRSYAMSGGATTLAVVSLAYLKLHELWRT